MNTKNGSTPTHAYLQTNVSCNDPLMASLRQGFIESNLGPAERACFAQHLYGCLACAAAVTNAMTMAQVSAEGADDATLTACLEPVRLIEPPCSNWRETVAKLMTFRK